MIQSPLPKIRSRTHQTQSIPQKKQPFEGAREGKLRHALQDLLLGVAVGELLDDPWGAVLPPRAHHLTPTLQESAWVLSGMKGRRRLKGPSRWCCCCWQLCGRGGCDNDDEDNYMITYDGEVGGQ